jgi:hypothetical protein
MGSKAAIAPPKEQNPMKTLAIAAAVAVLGLAAPVLAQTAAPAATAVTALSVENTKIGDIIANAAAKAVLEKEIPAIAEYYDQIRDMTLAQVAPMSQGAIDDAKLKALQAEFDKIK